MLEADARTRRDVNHLAELVYELLDAHVDTITMADELQGGPHWDAHLAYIRDLQRVGRERLARVQELPPRGSTGSTRTPGLHRLRGRRP